MFQVWQSVKVIAEGHARQGQAGTVHAVDPKHPEEVAVKFDLDGQVQAVAVTDLQVL